MRVLYIAGVGAWGGGSRSLYEVLSKMPADKVEKYFILASGTVVPKFSPLAKDMVVSSGITRFDNSLYSHYRGVRWIVVLRELVRLPATILAVFKAYKKWNGQIDLIHTNEIMDLFPLLLAKRLFKVPVVMHVRSVQNASNTWISKRLEKSISKNVDSVIAIDENVKSSLSPKLNIDVIHNSFSLSGSDEIDENFRKRLSQIKPGRLRIGFIGNLLKVKGLLDLVDAAVLLGERKSEVDFIVVGGEADNSRSLKGRFAKVLGLQQNIGPEIQQRIEQNQLKDNFHMLGSTFDIRAALESFDVICFPSHLDAPGRPVFEAAFFGVPSIVAVSDPKPDTLRHMETGIAIKAKDHQELTNAILYFLDNKDETERMGKNAQELAEQNFNSSTNAKLLYSTYCETLD